jgi:hypothetical protein
MQLLDGTGRSVPRAGHARLFARGLPVRMLAPPWLTYRRKPMPPEKRRKARLESMNKARPYLNSSITVFSMGISLQCSRYVSRAVLGI